MGVAKLFIWFGIQLLGEVVQCGFQYTWCSSSFSKHVESLQYSRSDRWLLGTNLAQLDYNDDFFIALGGSLQIFVGTTFSYRSPLTITSKKVENGSLLGHIYLPLCMLLLPL